MTIREHEELENLRRQVARLQADLAGARTAYEKHRYWCEQLADMVEDLLYCQLTPEAVEQHKETWREYCTFDMLTQPPTKVPLDRDP